MAKLAQKVKLWLHHSSLNLSVQMSRDQTYMWIFETVCILLFSHQDRNVTVCTAHSLCTVYTRVAALLAAQMTPPEIKLNYRRFSRTMIQREMKVNFDFSMLLMVEKWGSLWQRWANTVFWTQGCISCGILLPGTWARGVSSEHMENMEMFSCSPT